MKAIRVRAFGGPDELRVEDIEIPTPGEGEVRLRVYAAGMNFTDLKLLDGTIPGAPAFPLTPGAEAAGTVDAVGPGVHGIVTGARVVAVLPRLGAFAEYAIAQAADVTSIPPTLAFEKAVALRVQAPTALLALRSAARPRDGETVVVPAAAGGVGSFLVQLAKRFGARVIGAASSEEKRALAMHLGADVTIDSTAVDWPDRVREETAGRGADVVLVMNGGATTAQSLGALASRGRVVLYGVEAMLDTSLGREQLMSLVAQNQSIIGFATFTLPREEVRAALDEVIALVGRGELEVVVGETFALQDVPAAYRAMTARKTTGKVVIRVRTDA